jgi:pimeloyl-ACP methyl ester carboxylesterase
LWQFDEQPPGAARYFTARLDGRTIEGRVLAAGAAPPGLLAIHGARSDYTRLNPLLYPLQALGAGSLGFNLSGHSAASGVSPGETSLGANLREALHFAACIAGGPRAVLGHSMGGALALKVAQAHRATVRKIVLCCPALYPENAYGEPFGSAFRAAISVPHGFIGSPSLGFLRAFEGEVLLLMGQYDGLRATDFGGVAGRSAGAVEVADGDMRRTVNSAIPHEVIEALEDAVPCGRLRKIVIPGCDHAVSSWLRANHAAAAGLAREIAVFLAL